MERCFLDEDVLYLWVWGWVNSKRMEMSRLTKWQRQFIGEVSKMSSSELFDALGDEFSTMESLGGEYDRWKFDVVINEVRERFSPSVAPDHPEKAYEGKRYWFVSGKVFKDAQWCPWHRMVMSDGMFDMDEVRSDVRSSNGSDEVAVTWWKELTEDEYNRMS